MLKNILDFLQNFFFRLLRFARNDRHCEEQQRNNDCHCEEERRSNLSFTKTLLFFFLALFIFAGCSSKTVTTAPEAVYEPKKENTWVSKALHKEYDKWCETPYKYGGQTLQGTDCSSLVQQVYQDAFGIKIPRTSVEQAQIGYEVPRNSCKEGDLVFFKVDSKTRHSGIMIDKEKFLHASTTEGVKISQLNDPYWKSKYLQTRRVIP